MRHTNGFDRLLSKLDATVKTVAGGKTSAHGDSPADPVSENQLTHQQRKKTVRLMRVNHCGEVCAQALYQGQALTSKSGEIKETLAQAALEEENHLYWCEKRIKELGGHLSLLNPFFYASSYATGIVVGALGNPINLGFLAATEEEVCRHLSRHLDSLAHIDLKSKAILEQMLKDEAKHATTALDSGGIIFPAFIKKFMHSLSNLMTKTTYWI